MPKKDTEKGREQQAQQTAKRYQEKRQQQSSQDQAKREGPGQGNNKHTQSQQVQARGQPNQRGIHQAGAPRPDGVGGTRTEAKDNYGRVGRTSYTGAQSGRTTGFEHQGTNGSNRPHSIQETRANRTNNKTQLQRNAVIRQQAKGSMPSQNQARRIWHTK